MWTSGNTQEYGTILSPLEHSGLVIWYRKRKITNIPPHEDDIKWMHFPHYGPFVRGIHESRVNSHHKGQWCGALMSSLISVWTNGWANTWDAGDLRRHRAHYNVTVMHGDTRGIIWNKQCIPISINRDFPSVKWNSIVIFWSISRLILYSSAIFTTQTTVHTRLHVILVVIWSVTKHCGKRNYVVYKYRANTYISSIQTIKCTFYLA